MFEDNLLLAFALTLLAGLSTGIGSAIVFLSRRPRTSHLSFALGFSAGVMTYISLVEMLPGAQHIIGQAVSEGRAEWISIACFFLGIGVSALIDFLVPSNENPHEPRSAEDIARLCKDGPENSTGPCLKADAASRRRLMRTGTLMALAIGIHNFPEGFATFVGTLADPAFGMSIAVAVAVHNIPEGISVSVPIYFATGDRKKAFIYSFLSGLAEPVGAVLGYLALRPFLNDVVVGASFAAVAGIMVFISFDELLPAAREYGKGHTAIAGVVLGMAVMAVSLALL